VRTIPTECLRGRGIIYLDIGFIGLKIGVIEQFDDPIENNVGMIGQDVNDDGQDEGIK
jgi:hypothetical protein